MDLIKSTAKKIFCLGKTVSNVVSLFLNISGWVFFDVVECVSESYTLVQNINAPWGSRVGLCRPLQNIHIIVLKLF